MNAPAWHLDAVTSALSLQTLTTALVNTPGYFPSHATFQVLVDPELPFAWFLYHHLKNFPSLTLLLRPTEY